MEHIDHSKPIDAARPIAASPATPLAQLRDTTPSAPSPEAPAITPSIRDRFSKEVMPLLLCIRDSERFANNPTDIQRLHALAESPELRAVIWEHVGAYGVPHNLSLSQRQALATTMLPYIATDKEQSWNALVAITSRAVSSGDMLSYELAGRAALAAQLPHVMVELLALSFVQYETHNASRVPALKPWMKLFIENASEDSCIILLDNLVRRLSAGEVSSYDHTLSVLCQTQHPIVVQSIRNGATPPTFDKRFLEPPVSLLAGLCVCEMVAMLPVATITTYLIGGSTGMWSMYTPALAGALSIFRTLSTHRPALKALALEETAATQSFIKSPCYGHYVDKLFTKLCPLSVDRKEIADIVDAMESHPFFTNKHASWREIRQRSTNQE